MVSLPSLLSCLGVLSATFAPALVLAVTTVSTQPVFILLAVFAAFLWACSASLAALAWLLLVPLRPHLWLLLLYAVALQELARWGTYALHERLMRGMRSVGLSPADRRRAVAQLVPSAVASGLGAGVMQVLVMHGDVLAGSLRPGTLYTPACSALSLFAVDALTDLALILLNVLLSILGWTHAYPRGSARAWSALVALHLLASASTLLNTQLPAVVPVGDGCAFSLPCLYAVVLCAAALAARAAASSVCAAHGDATSPSASGAHAGGGRL